MATVLEAVTCELHEALARVRETTGADPKLSGLVGRIADGVARAIALSRGEARGRPGDPLRRVVSAAAVAGPMFPSLEESSVRLRACIAARQWAPRPHRTPALLSFVNALDNFQRELVNRAYHAESVEALSLLFAAGQLDAIEVTVSDTITHALAN